VVFVSASFIRTWEVRVVGETATQARQHLDGVVACPGPLAPVLSLYRHRSTFANGASEESLPVLALATQRHRAGCSYGSVRAVGLEVLEPGFDCRFAETSIPAESDMRYPARSSLRPDPVGLHAEKPQQPDPAVNSLSMIVPSHGELGARPAECRGRVACRKRAQSSAVVAHPSRGCLISSRSCLSSNLENCGPQVGTVLAGERVATVDGNLQRRRRSRKIENDGLIRYHCDGLTRDPPCPTGG